MKTKVHNLISSRSGRPVANQYEIITKDNYIFQSYNSIIAKVNRKNNQITLDDYYWDYSATTLKYLKQFLNISLTKDEIKRNIDIGMYKTANLNTK
tara:strand:- start:691 stop:978 length:288 start_codon:yes stop_codon:yes gene_type:complete